MNKPGKIFISYRRDDSADSTGRIYERLVSHFGTESVVRDVDSIPHGVDFRDYLAGEVDQCQVFLAVIGKDWVKMKTPSGRRRLDDPRDFVRIEVEAALNRNIPIIPVFVMGASVPDESQVPPSLRSLVFRHGMSVRSDPDFHRDVDRLIKSLDQLVQDTPAAELRAAPNTSEVAGEPSHLGLGVPLDENPHQGEVVDDPYAWQTSQSANPRRAGVVDENPRQVDANLRGTWFTRPACDPTAKWVEAGDSADAIAWALIIGAPPVAGLLAYFELVDYIVPVAVGIFGTVASICLHKQLAAVIRRLLRGAPELVPMEATDKHYRLKAEIATTDGELARLPSLPGITSLRELSLSDCEQITDAGLVHLRSLASLQKLELHSCDRITDAGVKSIRQALPNCKVEHQVVCPQEGEEEIPF